MLADTVVKTHRILAGASLAVALFCAPEAYAQCTTSDWTSQTGTVLAIGPDTTPVGRHYVGDCGLTVNATGSPGFVTKTLDAGEDSIASRFYLYPNDFSLNSGEVVLFEGLEGGTIQVRVSMREAGSGFELLTTFRDNGSLVVAGRTVPVLNTWQAVTVGWSADAVGGSVAIEIDGDRKLFINDIDNGGAEIDGLRLGMINGASAAGSLAFDQVEIRRSVTEMPLLPVNELFNISTRAKVGTGARAVVGGFIIEGDEEKCVVVRGRGQSINLSVARVTNPTLSLFESGASTPLETNDDWGDHPQASLMESLGRAPGHFRDAAIYRCLPPGGYTAQVRGAAGSTLGLGIVEVIDVDSGKPYLFNISTRAEVRAGSERAVAGFIIEGDTPKTVLIRGRGPTVNLNVTRLENPTLELKRGATTIATNDNWRDALNWTQIQATGRNPTNNRESAILTSLEPGAYTVFLAASNTQYGIGIIEVLDMSGGSIGGN